MPPHTRTSVSASNRTEEVRASLRISAISIGCTLVGSTAAITLGVRDASAVLVAFGAIGLVDAIGSVALVYHFRHALRHDYFSEHLEQLAHRIVLFGLFGVGLGAVIVSGARLAMGSESDPSLASTALAAVSLVVLVLLATRKVVLAARVSSPALRADGQLSGIGATQAAVALVGTVATRRLGWHWADGVAAIVVGCIAMAVAATTFYRESSR